MDHLGTAANRRPSEHLVTSAPRAGCLPPTAHLDDVDPACDIDVITGEARSAHVEAILSTSLGFWGMHVALVFAECEGG